MAGIYMALSAQNSQPTLLKVAKYGIKPAPL